MKIQELRIGNLLMDSLTKAELKVIELTESTIVTSVIDRKLYPLPSGWKATQIPLTEDELTRLGFWHDGYYNSAKRFVSKSPLIMIQGNGYYTLPCYFHCEIKHVNQLQNLYFDLTGEELNYQKP
jgi:hypothetical protein